MILALLTESTWQSIGEVILLFFIPIGIVAILAVIISLFWAAYLDIFKDN